MLAESQELQLRIAEAQERRREEATRELTRLVKKYFLCNELTQKELLALPTHLDTLDQPMSKFDELVKVLRDEQSFRERLASMAPAEELQAAHDKIADKKKALEAEVAALCKPLEQARKALERRRGTALAISGLRVNHPFLFATE